MKPIKLPVVFVVGNEKGGAGKTTCSMHLIAGLLDLGLKVASIDVDCRQHSLTRYLQNREAYNKANPEKTVPMPLHFLLNESTANSIAEREAEDRHNFDKAMAEATAYATVILIDTPGSHSYLSKLAHSHADKVITPINDSFVDLDVMAKIDPSGLNVVSPSIYSQMIWEQKMERAKRDGSSIDWVVMRNRLSNIDATNKRNVATVLDQLAKRVSFKVIPGFSERVIFKELFLLGLTLLDLTRANYNKPFNLSHVAARQELRDFMQSLGVDAIVNAKMQDDNMLVAG